MARLIDADKISLPVLNENDMAGRFIATMGERGAGRVLAVAKELLRKTVAEAPTVDAVEVVRCKDCFWWHDFETHMDCRNPFGIDLPEPDDFCSFGERRTDEAD